MTHSDIAIRRYDSEVFAPDESGELLDGVARAVVLDYRMRVEWALATTAAEPELDPMESRAG